MDAFARVLAGIAEVNLKPILFRLHSLIWLSFYTVYIANIVIIFLFELIGCLVYKSYIQLSNLFQTIFLCKKYFKIALREHSFKGFVHRNFARHFYYGSIENILNDLIKHFPKLS